MQQGAAGEGAEGVEETVADYFVRLYGTEAFERMIEPLVSGIFAGDARRLSLGAAFPQLANRGSTQGAEGRVAASGGEVAALPPFVSYSGGMQSLTDALESYIDSKHLRPGSPVRAVRRGRAGFLLELPDGVVVESDALILALSPHELSEVVAPLSPDLAQAHAEIEAASTVVVNLGYATADLPKPLEGYGYLSPMADGRLFHACTWSSSKWPGRAPDGFAAIRLYGGRYGEHDLFDAGDSEILRLAALELEEVMGIAADPVISRVTRWSRAIPQYNLGYSAVLNRIRKAVDDQPGLFLAGAAYGGVGIPDCIRSGEAAAKGAVAYLTQGRRET